MARAYLYDLLEHVHSRYQGLMVREFVDDLMVRAEGHRSLVRHQMAKGAATLVDGIQQLGLQVSEKTVLLGHGSVQRLSRRGRACATRATCGTSCGSVQRLSRLGCPSAPDTACRFCFGIVRQFSCSGRCCGVRVFWSSRSKESQVQFP